MHRLARRPPAEAEAEYYSQHVTDRPAGSQNPEGACNPGWFTSWERLRSANIHSTVLPVAHIHAVKGAEFDAVLLDIEDQPKGTRPHILKLWQPEDTSEARRVLYVGASRARRLLVLAVPPKHLDALRDILQDLDPHVAYLVDDDTDRNDS